MSDAVPPLEARIPPGLQAIVNEGHEAAHRERVEQRIAERDATLWGPPGAPEVADRLGWVTIAQRMLDEVDSVEAFASEVRDAGVRDVVLLGMGGSSLAPEVLRRCFPPSAGSPRLRVLDSTDAAAVREVDEQVAANHALFIVSSKSGGTIEPLSLFQHFWSLAPHGERFAAITDPGSGLEELARSHGFKRVFAGDPEIGGRYSALSAFGIVPAALIGVDVRSLLRDAPRAWDTPVDEHAHDADRGAPTAERSMSAGVWLGTALGALARAGTDKLTFLISRSLPGLGLWLEQLVAESTGKRGTGILPVADEPPGEPSDYGEDRVFAYLPDVQRPDPQLEDCARALADAGHPVFTLPTHGPADLGRVFMLWEIAVATAGWALSINPFDQPNVQQAKDATKRVLAQYERTGELPAIADSDSRAIAGLLGAARPPEYIALMGYLAPSAEFDAAVAKLRTAVRARTKVTTTFGYGPRFLHSTGQFHKGGPRTGRFLQLLHDDAPDVPIPGAGYTFNTLKNAQAIGDQETLRELGLPMERMHLDGDPARALAELVAQLDTNAHSGRPR